MPPRAPVIAVTHVECRRFGHDGPPLFAGSPLLSKETAASNRLPATAPALYTVAHGRPHRPLADGARRRTDVGAPALLLYITSRLATTTAESGPVVAVRIASLVVPVSPDGESPWPMRACSGAWGLPGARMAVSRSHLVEGLLTGASAFA